LSNFCEFFADSFDLSFI